MGQIIGTQMEKSEHSYYSPAVQKVPDSDYAIVDLCHKGVLVTRRGQDGAHYPNTTPTVVAAAVAVAVAAVAVAVAALFERVFVGVLLQDVSMLGISCLRLLLRSTIAVSFFVSSLRTTTFVVVRVG